MANSSSSWHLPFVVFWTCLLFFGRLDCALLEPEEARYAQIPREMLEQDSGLTPLLRGQPYCDKPPLMYWLVMASYSVFGVHDWAARIVPGLCGSLSVLVAYSWSRRTLGPWPGFWTALVLSLSARFVYQARMIGMDTLLALEVIAAAAALHLALDRPKLSWMWWMIAASACGLGIMTKGLAIWFLLMPPLILWCYLNGKRIGIKWWLVHLLIVATIAAPWFVYMSLARPEFASTFFFRHHLTRFLEPFDHAKPWWFYLPYVFLGMFPWTLLLPTALRMFRSDLPSAARFALLAGGWILLFFSMSGCKRPAYILTAMPLLAVPLGWSMEWTRTQGFFRSRRKSLVCGMAGMHIVLFLTIFVGLPAYTESFSFRTPLSKLAGQTGPIVCFPREWDSVRFYLPNSDQEVLPSADGRDVEEILSSQKDAVLIVQTGSAWERLARMLGATMRLDVLHESRMCLVVSVTPK